MGIHLKVCPRLLTSQICLSQPRWPSGLRPMLLCSHTHTHTHTHTSHLRSVSLFLPENIYRGELGATLGNACPKETNHQYGGHEFIGHLDYSSTYSTPHLQSHELTLNMLCYKAADKFTWYFLWKNKEPSVHCILEQTSFNTSAKNHTIVRTTNNESDWLLQSTEIACYSGWNN
jgi:hypothetical protein